MNKSKKTAPVKMLNEVTQIVYTIQLTGGLYQVVYDVNAKCADVYDITKKLYYRATNWFCRIPGVECDSRNDALQLLHKALTNP